MVAQRRVRKCPNRQLVVTRVHAGPHQPIEPTDSNGLPLVGESTAERIQSAYVSAADLWEIVTGLSVDVVSSEDLGIVKGTLDQLSADLDLLVGDTPAGMVDGASWDAAEVRRFANQLSPVDLTPGNWGAVADGLGKVARKLDLARKCAERWAG